MNGKILIILFVMLCFCSFADAKGFDMNLPLPGKSIANDTLQLNVINKIYKDALKDFSSCSDFSIIDTQIVHYPYDVVKKNNKYKKGYWKEIWILNACGVKKQIPLTFYINNYKTTFSLDMN